MRFIVNILFSLFFVSTYCQEKDFYVVDNSNYKIYKNKKVKRLKSYKTDLLNGGTDGKYLEVIRDFDIYGNIIKEREYYDKDTTDGIEIKHFYNKKHKLLKTEWFWLDDKKTEITEYEYNKNGKLKRSYDYNEYLDSVKLESRNKYIYRKGIISKVKSNNKIKFYYKKIDSVLVKYSNKKELISKYFNGEVVHLNDNSWTTNYKRNYNGQITKIETRNSENEIITTYLYEYKNNLLTKIIKNNSAGSTIEFDDIIYELY